MFVMWCIFHCEDGHLNGKLCVNSITLRWLRKQKYPVLSKCLKAWYENVVLLFLPFFDGKPIDLFNHCFHVGYVAYCLRKLWHARVFSRGVQPEIWCKLQDYWLPTLHGFEKL